MFDTVLNLFFVAPVVYFPADDAIYFVRAKSSLKQHLLAYGYNSPLITSSRFVSYVSVGINSAI